MGLLEYKFFLEWEKNENKYGLLEEGWFNFAPIIPNVSQIKLGEFHFFLSADEDNDGAMRYKGGLYLNNDEILTISGEPDFIKDMIEKAVNEKIKVIAYNVIHFFNEGETYEKVRLEKK